MSGELLDLSAFPSPRARPARAALEELIAWVLPVADELGVAGHLAVPARNAAERQIEAHETGATIEQIYADQVVWTRELVGG